MEIKIKLLVLLMMNFPLIVLTKNILLSDIDDSQINKNASPIAINKSSDINSKVSLNLSLNEEIQDDVEFSTMMTEFSTVPETTTYISVTTTTTEDPKSILIPPAFVEAQIEKVNISSNNVSKQKEA